MGTDHQSTLMLSSGLRILITLAPVANALCYSWATKLRRRCIARDSPCSQESEGKLVSYNVTLGDRTVNEIPDTSMQSSPASITLIEQECCPDSAGAGDDVFWVDVDVLDSLDLPWKNEAGIFTKQPNPANTFRGVAN